MSDKRTHVVIVDSGLKEDCVNENILSSYTVVQNGEGYGIESGAIDTLGHGTAVHDILTTHAPDVQVTVYKAFENEVTTDFQRIIFTLEHILEYTDCDILHLSMGFKIVEDMQRLRELLKRFEQRKTLIVCAFDNSGTISYPAALEEVIGVDLGNGLESITEYDVAQGNVVDVLTFDGYLRTKWVNPPKIIIKGTSFSSVYITAKLAELISIYGRMTKDKAMELLSESARNVYPQKIDLAMLRGLVSHNYSQIKKAIAFPCNKEMHSLLAYKDMLNFELEGIYDVRFTGNIGKTASKLVPYARMNEDMIVTDYANIDWEGDWDTLICGHCGPINKQAKKDVFLELLTLCSEHNKHMFSFDHIFDREKLPEELARCLFFPFIDENYIPVNRFGKLRYAGKPVVAVMGTSSVQGKFTLQLELRKRFLAEGYHLGQIGTEPSSRLFGMQECFPMGYNASVFLEPRESVPVLNEMIWELEKDNCDIILAGCQSGTLQYDVGNESRLCYESHEFLLGINPDTSILCVNPHDDLKYVKRTIAYIESVSGNKVCAICLYPVEKKPNQLGYGYVNNRLDKKQLEQIRRQFEETLEKPVFISGIREELDALYECIIDFFTVG